MKNICKNSLDMRWHQKMALKILALKISKKFVKMLHNEEKTMISQKNHQIDANFALRVASNYGIKNWLQFFP